MPTGAPDYFKRILLYGLYGDVATPLAVDAQGRIVVTVEVVSPFDKSGTILMEDSFEDGLVHVQTSAIGDGGSVAVDTAEAVTGAQSCKLTGGSTGAALAQVKYGVTPSALDKIGLEIPMRIGDDVKQVQLWLQVYTGSEVVSGILRWDNASNIWRVSAGPSGAYQTFLTDTNYIEGAVIFHRFKMVIDIANLIYTRFRHPGGEADLSAYALLHSDDVTSPLIYASITVTSDAGTNAWILIDDVIITQDES